MRLVIEVNEKYKGLFYEAVRATDAVIIAEEPEHWMDYPEHVRKGVEKSLMQAESGQVKSYEEVKKILAERWPSK